MSLATQSGWR